MKLFQGELQECIDCIKIAKQYGEKDFNNFTNEVLKKLERMKKEEEDYQNKD